MKGKMLKKVGEIARMIAKDNYPFYTEDMVQLVTQAILEKRLTNENLLETMKQIDYIRFEKEQELAIMSGVKMNDQELFDTIKDESRFDKLAPTQQRKVKEIKFLFNVAATVVHQ